MTDTVTRPGFFGNLPILALALASFGIGTTEFVIMGLLPDVALDLGVSLPDAGLLVTGYALGVTFGAPFLAIATARMDRRRALLLLISIFILGNFLCAIAPDYWLLMAARVVTAFCHGAFFGLGAVVASNLVAPHKRVQAIALMFSGLTLANVLGVPFGTALGQELGWRSTFWAVVAIGVVAASALYVALPRQIAASTGSLWLEAKSLGKKQVLLAMLISVLASASLFSVFTYRGWLDGGQLYRWAFGGLAFDARHHHGLCLADCDSCPVHRNPDVGHSGRRNRDVVGRGGLCTGVPASDARGERGIRCAQPCLNP